LRVDGDMHLALIISNAAYPSEVGPLANPHRDGEVIATGLKAVGFEKCNIVIVKDAYQPDLRDGGCRLRRAHRKGRSRCRHVLSNHDGGDRTDSRED
jgi:hypothetical protein